MTGGAWLALVALLAAPLPPERPGAGVGSAPSAPMPTATPAPTPWPATPGPDRAPPPGPRSAALQPAAALAPGPAPQHAPPPPRRAAPVAGEGGAGEPGGAEGPADAGVAERPADPAKGVGPADQGAGDDAAEQVAPPSDVAPGAAPGGVAAVAPGAAPSPPGRPALAPQRRPSRDSGTLSSRDGGAVSGRDDVVLPGAVARDLGRAAPVSPMRRAVPDDGTDLALNAVPSDRFVCRDPRLSGVAVPDIGVPGRGCGVLDPVRIAAVGRVRLSTPAVMTCPMARKFANWLGGVAEPAARAQLGASITQVWVMGSYVCRNRNGLAGGRLSEHANGRAIDIGGVTLSDGRRLTVLGDWGRGAPGRFWRDARAAACGTFQTVLGPGSDRFHANHLHFDASPRGGSPYCR